MKVLMIHPHKLGESDNKNYEKSGRARLSLTRGGKFHFVGKINKC